MKTLPRSIRIHATGEMFAEIDDDVASALLREAFIDFGLENVDVSVRTLPQATVDVSGGRFGYAVRDQIEIPRDGAVIIHDDGTIVVYEN